MPFASPTRLCTRRLLPKNFPCAFSNIQPNTPTITTPSTGTSRLTIVTTIATRSSTTDTTGVPTRPLCKFTARLPRTFNACTTIAHATPYPSHKISLPFATINANKIPPAAGRTTL